MKDVGYGLCSCLLWCAHAVRFRATRVTAAELPFCILWRYRTHARTAGPRPLLCYCDLRPPNISLPACPKALRDHVAGSHEGSGPGREPQWVACTLPTVVLDRFHFVWVLGFRLSRSTARVGRPHAVCAPAPSLRAFPPAPAHLLSLLRLRTCFRSCAFAPAVCLPVVIARALLRPAVCYRVHVTHC